MEVHDNTINIKFSDLDVGNCFVWYSVYYMKTKIAIYDEYNNTERYEYCAVNLETGYAAKINEEEKVRLINTKLLVY